MKVESCKLQVRITLKDYKDKVNYLAYSEKNAGEFALRDCCSEEQANSCINNRGSSPFYSIKRERIWEQLRDGRNYLLPRDLLLSAC